MTREPTEREVKAARELGMPVKDYMLLTSIREDDLDEDDDIMTKRKKKPAAAAPDTRSVYDKFLEAKRQADTAGAFKFTFYNKVYVKDQGAWQREDGGKLPQPPQPKSPCAGYDTSESCNADPACSFAKGPGKPHCKKRASPKRASPKRAPALPPLVAATPFLGPAPAGVATARARVMGTQAANYAMPALAPR